jgi:hypothetical protein
MIRQSPEVPAAVELADVSSFIMRVERIVVDPVFKGGWSWQSPKEFDPLLKLVVGKSGYIYRSDIGKFVVKSSLLGIIDKGSEYWLEIPQEPENIEDDPYIEDFVQAFRQYELGRSELIIPN